MYQIFKNLLGYKTLAENIDELNSLNKSFGEIESLLDIMAKEFTVKNEQRKRSIKDSYLEPEIKKSIEDKFEVFYKSYNENLSELLDRRRKILKSKNKIEAKNDVKNYIDEQNYFKKSFLEGKISHEIFLNIMNMQQSVVDDIVNDDISKASKKQENKASKVMREFYDGDLKSGSGDTVTSRKQAQAIAMSEAGISKKETPKKSIDEVAKKHGVTVDSLRHELKMGMKVEKEHNDDPAITRKIALDHLWEMPDYYTKLIDMEHEEKENDDQNKDVEKSDPGKTFFSAEERRKLADKDHAMPDGSFPIRNKKDLHDAIQSFGRASDDKQAAVKKFIERRAKELDQESVLPQNWEVKKSEKEEKHYPGETKKEHEAHESKESKTREKLEHEPGGYEHKEAPSKKEFLRRENEGEEKHSKEKLNKADYYQPNDAKYTKGKYEEDRDFLTKSFLLVGYNINALNQIDLLEFTEFPEMEIKKASYEGNEVELNKPMAGDNKKYKVYLKNNSDKIIKVDFGDPGMEISHKNTDKRKSFRTKHQCDIKKDQPQSGYWSCMQKNENGGKEITKALDVMLLQGDIYPEQYENLMSKAKTGTYADNEMNRKLGRVGEKYGKVDEEEDEDKKKPQEKPISDKKNEIDSKESKDQPTDENIDEEKEEKPKVVDIKDSKRKKLLQLASQTSAQNLQAAIKNSDDPKLRAIAQEELNRRKKEEVATKAI
jgi:hypothetical protein